MMAGKGTDERETYHSPFQRTLVSGKAETGARMHTSNEKGLVADFRHENHRYAGDKRGRERIIRVSLGLVERVLQRSSRLRSTSERAV